MGILFVSILFLFHKKHKVIFYIIASLLVVILGALSFTNKTKLPPSHVSNIAKAKESKGYISVEIVSQPEYRWMRSGRRRASFIAKALSYNHNGKWLDANGLVLVNIWNNERGLSYGERLLLSGSIKEPPGARSKGGFDYAKYLMRKNIYIMMDVKNDFYIESVPRQEAGLAFSLVPVTMYKVRRGIEKLIRRYLDYGDSAILDAMIIGKRSYLTKELRDLFVKTGTAHILSVSGLHVAIISSVVFFMLRLFRLPRKLLYGLLLIFLCSYILIAGARPPIIRAVLMIGVYIISYIFERDFDIYSAIATAGLIILLYNPMQVFDIGFILSFSCVFSICYLTPKLSLLMPKPGKSILKKSLFRVGQLFAASLAVYVGVMPIIAYYFHIISPITVLANLFVVPMLGLILSLAIGFLLAGSTIPALGSLLGLCLHWLLSNLAGGLKVLGRVPFSYFEIPQIPLSYLIFYYAILFLLLERKRLLCYNVNIKKKH